MPQFHIVPFVFNGGYLRVSTPSPIYNTPATAIKYICPAPGDFATKRVLVPFCLSQYTPPAVVAAADIVSATPVGFDKVSVVAVDAVTVNVPLFFGFVTKPVIENCSPK